MTFHSDNHSLKQTFFKPLVDAFNLSQHQRKATSLTYINFLFMGVERVMGSFKSGHDFIQKYRKDDGARVKVSHYFDSLKSASRLKNVASVNWQLKHTMQDVCDDELAKVVELKGWHVLAADGHYHRAACFDPKTQADTSTKEPSKSPTGYFFSLDLRTHHMNLIDLARPDDGKKSEHDMKMLKRQEFHDLRVNARKGQKVFYFWDRACIDFKFWHEAKHNHGIYFATLAKSNQSLTKIDIHRDLDYSDGKNEGMMSDDLVATSKGYRIRRIIYIDPKDGKKYVYLTNEMTLEAWIIVLLYKHRWDIEKVFDETKKKLEEDKSWASSDIAKQNQALFICIAHNLMLILEIEIKQNEGLEDLVEARKSKTRERTRPLPKGQAWRGKSSSSFINNFFKRASQRTLRFIRWIRMHLENRASYRESIADLAVIWGCPL